MKEIPRKPEQVHPISRRDTFFKKAKPLSGQQEMFGKIFSEQFNLSPGTTASPNVSNGLPELEGVYTAATLKLPGSGTELTGKISAALDLLETYAATLFDPEKTLKHAYTLLEDLAQQTDQLFGELDPKTDPRLEQILTHLKAMVQVEQIKINRGDYITPH